MQFLKGISNNSKRRIDRSTRTEETPINDIEIIDIVGTAIEIENRTPGFIWEMNKIIQLGLQSKLILLMPPVKTQELTARWDTLVHEVKGVNLPRNIDLKRTRAVIFPGDQVVAIAADERNDWLPTCKIS